MLFSPYCTLLYNLHLWPPLTKTEPHDRPPSMAAIQDNRVNSMAQRDGSLNGSSHTKVNVKGEYRQAREIIINPEVSRQRLGFNQCQIPNVYNLQEDSAGYLVLGCCSSVFYLLLQLVSWYTFSWLGKKLTCKTLADGISWLLQADDLQKPSRLIANLAFIDSADAFSPKWPNHKAEQVKVNGLPQWPDGDPLAVRRKNLSSKP